MESFVSLILFAIIGVVSVSYINYYVAVQKRKTEAKKLQRERIAFQNEKIKREQKEIEFFAKHPKSYKLLKAISGDGKSITIDIEEHYKNIFIEYLHHFKKFAAIKGYRADLDIEKTLQNKLYCNIELTPINKKMSAVQPEVIFRNYLVSYPIFF